MSRQRKTEEEIQEASSWGRRLPPCGYLAARRSAKWLGGLNPQRICKAERGHLYPRHSLMRILAGMGVAFAALHRAQDLVQNPMGEIAEPIDAPDFTPEEAHQAAVRLAQEASKAVAHCCCLSFMEIGARGWRLSSGAGNGRSQGIG